MSNLTTRVIVAVAGIPIILLVTLAGGFYFYAFVLVIAVVAIHELYGLARRKGFMPQTVLGTLLGAGIVTAFLYFRIRTLLLGAMLERGFQVPFPSMAQGILIMMVVAVPLSLTTELFRGKPGALGNVAATLLGASYVGFSLGSLVGVRELFVPEDFPVYAFFPFHGASVPEEAAATVYQWGGRTVVAVFAAIWLCDSAAFFVGRAFGRRALFARVSPKKTWEGAIAGFIFAVGAFLLARVIAIPYLSVTDAWVCGAIVGIFGQIGDLAESLLKRDAGVKDSSLLIPGHGGVLDRFDSILFVAPLIFLYLDFIVF